LSVNDRMLVSTNRTLLKIGMVLDINGVAVSRSRN
jgi:hypothetical protein